MVVEPASLKGLKYPAKEHAKKVYTKFKALKGDELIKAIFFISGDDLEAIKYCDQTKPFRQNRYFFYLSGVSIPGSHVIYDCKNDRLVLYLPNIDEEDVMWSGLPLSLEEARKTFEVDDVKYASELAADVKSFDGLQIYTTDINDQNRQFSDVLREQDVDFFEALDESRLIKDHYELELMRHAARITDKCHYAVMTAVPIETKETHIHAEFMYHALRQGSKFQAYDPICCSGTSCSTLHYVKNDGDIPMSKRSILIDAGAEWECYASDVTRCFPINGDWTKEHLEIYNIVSKMQSGTMALIKPGAHWDEIHLTAHKILIDEFLHLSIFNSEFSAEEIFESKISVAFFPHGLGHLLGMDTHDVGGRPNYNDPDPLLRYLRLRRPLQEGMVLTDEPGVYFSPFLLKDVLEDSDKSKFINKETLEKYWYIGGVRIEDDLLITANGFENFTAITSDPLEISKIIKNGFKRNDEGKFHNVV